MTFIFLWLIDRYCHGSKAFFKMMLLIHADQVPVELMQNVEKEMEQPPAHAYQDSMEILMWNVIQNPEFLASHHLVGSMLNALEDTDQHHVSASLITLEIPMLLVD